MTQRNRFLSIPRPLEKHAQDATHLRYPTVLPDSSTIVPLAVTAFPAPRGGFGPLIVSSCAAIDQLRRADWAAQAPPVLVAPSTERVAEVEAAAGEVWKTVFREAVAASGGEGRGVVSGMVGGMVGIGTSGVGGGGGAGAAAALATKASVTVVLKGGGSIRCVCPLACCVGGISAALQLVSTCDIARCVLRGR